MNIQQVRFECPSDWLSTDPLSGQNQKIFNVIKRSVEKIGLTFSRIDSERFADFAPRFADCHTLLISVHSVGVAPNVIRLKETYLPGYYYLDRTGYSGWAEISNNTEIQTLARNHKDNDDIALLTKIRNDKLSSNASKYNQSEYDLDSALNKYKRIIFFPLQTTDDAVARLSFVGQLKLLEWVAKSSDDFGYTLIVKSHPLCTSHYVKSTLNKIQSFYKNVRISTGSINQLIRLAKLVVTVNSSVGFESLLLGTTVVVAGKSDYGFLCQEIHSEKDVARILSSPPELNVAEVRSALAYYLSDYCINSNDALGVEKKIKNYLNTDIRLMNDLKDSSRYLLSSISKYIASDEILRRNLASGREELNSQSSSASLLKLVFDRIRMKCS